MAALRLVSPNSNAYECNSQGLLKPKTAGDPDGDGEMILFYDHDKVLECLLESHLRVEWVCNDSRLSVKYVSSPR